MDVVAGQVAQIDLGFVAEPAVETFVAAKVE